MGSDIDCINTIKHVKKSSKWTINEPTPHPATVQALPAALWGKEEHGIRCRACVRGCLLHENSLGFCTAIANWGGSLYSTAYGVIGEASVTPIENRPVYHYRPGSRVLGLGGLGCNLRCAFCQNWEVAFRDARQGGNLAVPNLSPVAAIALALKHGCAGIAWTFNEPTITPVYVRDCARIAHEAGLYTVFVTNGFLTREALNFLGPHIDVYRVDIKSVKSPFYQIVAGTVRNAELFTIAYEARETFGIHIEAVTNLMPTLNDSDEHLTHLTEQIVHWLGVQTPWHITSYVPYAHMTHIPPTPPETLTHARAIGQRAGLRFIYTDSPAAPETAHTYCPACQALVIERSALTIVNHALLPTGACAACGENLNIVTTSRQ